MDDEDYPMEEEESVVITTEATDLSEDHASSSVAPSRQYMSMNSHIKRRGELPIHNQSRVPSRLPFSLQQSHGSSSRSVRSSDGWPDEMDIRQPAPQRHTSPQVRIPPRPRSDVVPYATSKTGLVYDPRMRFHTTFPEQEIDEDGHPEDPRRIHAIFEEIKQAGLVRGHENADEDEREDHCWRIGIRPATKPEILLVHTEEHYAFVESLQHMTASQLMFEASELDSIYLNHSTYESAKLAVGGAIEACKAVVQGAVRNAIAIIRPPGHHAESSKPSGFCIFNNVPIATRVCQEAFPNTCRKVLILDWDVHHGNGIQHAFYNDPNVLYISLHVYQGGRFYPGLEDGDLNFSGEGPGEGKNVNIPWSDTGMGDAEYIYAFQQVVMPIASEFDPDLVIISAGFDAAEGDTLGGCFVTPACYGHMTHMLMRLAKGKLVVCLEGGYNLRSIARSALAVTRVLMLEPPDRLREDLPPPKEDAVYTIEQVKRQHSKHWKCLYPKHLDKTDPGFDDAFHLHEVIREWQSQRLSREHAMTPLPLQINKAGLAQTFEHNVIATPNFTDRHPLLIIFHDPPSFQDHLDPMTGQRELHNTWLRYVDWAVVNGFQVMDVNIPRVVSVENEFGYTRSDDSTVRAHQTRELATYLWENYVEPYDATQVFLMGIGDAYLGLVDLLSLNENCTEPDSPIACLIGFVAETAIQSIKRPTDDTIASWYFERSRIFVKNSHFAWDPARAKKLRRKLGNLVRSPMETLDTMLREHEEEVQSLLLKKKSEYAEDYLTSSVADERPQPTANGLRSPLPISRAQTPRGELGARHEGPTNSVKGPPRGFFTVPSQAPKSPLKRTF
ncbi:hypothetical protein P153DRAFT_357507 [Dothidotthia symphoricarpi CBS 119687]|uniref:Histone deacetylase n=1 Tax=Dothidotthia symphoricarpi CBS 119687 TaxID=1392245 RepID=A0A6A6ADJ8_9PLEO|nr:uncharacterized protein P153DRAFT_357507 [Dothidotthia symphoricarpi CBS 119687]KAF2129034.1 hypothetical protein P153DRAFT_357507 [Dothidotthia symphoricarpi CBS 119687]